MFGRNKNKTETKLITLREAAKIAGVTPQYLNILSRRRELKAEKLGRNWYTTKEWLNELIELREKKNIYPDSVVSDNATKYNIIKKPRVRQILLVAFVFIILLSFGGGALFEKRVSNFKFNFSLPEFTKLHKKTNNNIFGNIDSSQMGIESSRVKNLADTLSSKFITYNSQLAASNPQPETRNSQLAAHNANILLNHNLLKPAKNYLTFLRRSNSESILYLSQAKKLTIPKPRFGEFSRPLPKIDYSQMGVSTSGIKDLTDTISKKLATGNPQLITYNLPASAPEILGEEQSRNAQLVTHNALDFLKYGKDYLTFLRQSNIKVGNYLATLLGSVALIISVAIASAVSFISAVISKIIVFILSLKVFFQSFFASLNYLYLAFLLSALALVYLKSWVFRIYPLARILLPELQNWFSKKISQLKENMEERKMRLKISAWREKMELRKQEIEDIKSGVAFSWFRKKLFFQTSTLVIILFSALAFYQHLTEVNKNEFANKENNISGGMIQIAGENTGSDTNPRMAYESTNIGTESVLSALNFQKVAIPKGNYPIKSIKTFWQNDDLVFVQGRFLRVANSAITSKKIERHTIESEDIDTGSVNSRIIRDGTILGEDINPNTDITITGTITAGAMGLNGNLDMQSHLILNIGNAGTDFTAGGGLNLAGSLTLSSDLYLNSDEIHYGTDANHTIFRTVANKIYFNPDNEFDFTQATGELRNTTSAYLATDSGSVYVAGGYGATGVTISDTGAISANGLITGGAGITIIGAAVNLNANSNFATNINTGTSNGAVAIGGNLNTVAIDSFDWNITTAGAITNATYEGLTISTTTGTFTLTNGKTLAVTSTLTLSGTDSTIMTFPTTSATIARTDAGQTFTGTQTFSSAIVAPTTVNTINSLIINAGALSGISTIGLSGAITGATSYNGLVITANTGDITAGTWNGTIIADGKIASALTGKTYNGLTISATTGTFTLTNGKTLAVTSTLTLSGTDSTIMTFPTTSATIARTDAGQTFTGTQTFSSAIVAPTTVNTINSLIINAGALSGITTINMSGQLTNSYANTAALNLTGAGSGVTFTGTGPNQIITAAGVNLALMPGTTGNVGIGTTGPATRLHIEDNTTSPFTTVAGAVIKLRATTFDEATIGAGFIEHNGGGSMALGVTRTTGVIGFWPGNTEKVRFQATGGISVGASYLGTDAGAGSMILSGNVGIGTTDPSGKVTINNSTAPLRFTDDDITHGMTDYMPTNTWANFRLASATKGGLYLEGLYFGKDDYPIQLNGIFGDTNPDDGIPAVRLRGFKKNGTAGQALADTETVLQVANYTTALMTILGSGNVGIGTTGPAKKLEISGTSAYLRLTDTTNPANLTYFDIGTGAETGGLELSRNGTQLMRVRASGNINFGTGLYPNARFQVEKNTTYDYFAINNAVYGDVMVIKNNGNVGIGTTNPVTKLQVGVGSTVASTDIVRINTADTNVNALSISNWDGAVTTYGPRITFDNSGIGTFYVGGSDGANNFDIGRGWGTPDLRISSTGNVGIGTTGPNSTLSVLGNVSIGNVAVGTSGTRVLVLSNGTIPSTSPADSIQLYAEDVATSELKVRDEAGNISTLSPHNFSIIPGGPSEKLAWSYYSQRGNEAINVDMAKTVRLVEQLTGQQLIYLKNLKSGSYDESQPLLETPLALKIIEEQKTNLENLTLQTSENVTTLEELKSLFDKNTEAVEKKISSVNSGISDISDKITALEDQMRSLETKTNQDLGIAQIEANKNDIELIQMVLGMERVKDPADVDIMGKLSANGAEILGTLKAKDIEAETLKITDKEISGKGAIKAGETEIKIETPYASEDAKISITPKGSTSGKTLYFDDIVPGESFKVKIDKPALEDSDINFIWLIIK